jgi:coenzyme F420 biosynthesis associated uncharacterized protein
LSAVTLVDWGLAERTAATIIGGIGPVGRPAPQSPADRYPEAAVQAACAEAIEVAGRYAGLGPVAHPPQPELIDRVEWARVTLATLADAAGPLEERLRSELDLPGPLGSVARSVAGAATGAEAGLAVGYAGRRVLGQYDIALFGPERPARLLFVAENLASARRELHADHDLFLRWIALHECAHVIQFERVDWLADHVQGLARQLVDGTAAELDPGALKVFGRRLIRDPREVVREALRGELARALAGPAQVALLDRLQATMAVIEGHAEHVMDAGAAELGDRITDLRRRLDQRRARRGGLGEVLGRLLGFDLKLRQYELGKAFCDRVVELGGAEALIAVWSAPEALPELDELERPDAWLARVTGRSPQLA